MTEIDIPDPNQGAAKQSGLRSLDWKWIVAAVAVPLAVAFINSHKGAESKTSGNFTYVGSVSVIENQYLQSTGQPLKAEQKAQLTAALNLANNGEYAASRKILEATADTIPVAAVFTTIGSLYAEQGDASHAREFYDKALAKDGSYRAARDNLERLKSVRDEPKAVSGGHESEPNNDILHANIMPVGATVSGEIADPSDTDFFRFTAGHAPRDIYRITLTPSPTLRPDIVVYDSQRNQLFEDSRPTPGAILVRDFSPAADAPQYVRVGSYGNAGSYELTVQPQHRYDAYEPNDDIASAKTIAIGGTVEANIMDVSDTDFYQIRADAASLDLTLTPATSLKPDVVVYDPQKNMMFEDSRPTPGAILERKFDTKPGGIYYIQVGPYGGAGPYTLKVK